MCRVLPFLSAVFLVCFPPFVFPQLKFSPGSNLGNREFVERSVKNISDEDLFAALRTDVAGLRGVLHSAKSGESERAYELWASYWSRKRQPKYLTQDQKFLLDTEMLRTYGEVKAYAGEHPEDRDSILTRAAMLKRNIVRTWGDAVVDFGPTVDFNREVGQSGKYGFHYWYWSRPLLTAYVVTGDVSYLEKFDAFFHRWYEQRNSISRSIPDFDVVYYELGLATRTRTFIEYYFLPYANRPRNTHERILKTILGAARWLYELERAEGYRPGNWQIHGSYTLAQIAMVFPEFRESKEWLRIAVQRLREHLQQDFFADGGHSERAPRNYTLATYLCYRNLCYLLKAYKVGLDLEQRIRQRMGNTIDWWITMIAPPGEIPAINDSHRGLFPAFVLRDGAEFFKKPYVQGVLHNLFGSKTAQNSFPLPLFTSRHMPASGFSVMRTDWSRDALYMNINYGRWNGSHTHYDMLDFEIYAFGRALAVDAGLGLTYDDPLYIPWYRSSRAHNMVTANDQNIDRQTADGKRVVWSSGRFLDFFQAEHDGYAKLGIHHRRQIVFAKPNYWIVVDDLNCERGSDTLSWYIHTPSPLEPGVAGYQNTVSPGLQVVPVIGMGSVRLGRGMAASTSDLTPGKTEEISWLSFDRISSPGQANRFVVFLAPYRKFPGSMNCTTISGRHFQIRGENFTDDLYVSPDPIEEGSVASDARCVLIHHESGHLAQVSVVEGSYLRMNGREVWKAGKKGSAEFELK